MKLRESAAVARYLDELAYNYRGDQRKQLRQLSQAIWKQAFQSAEIPLARTALVVEFLNRFANTHFANHDVKSAVNAVRTASPPESTKPATQLRGKHLAVTRGPGGRRLSDDLSERIFAGYWFLRERSGGSARNKVADALNHHSIPRGAGSEDQRWAGSDVGERVKQYERHAGPSSTTEREVWRASHVGKWVSAYQESHRS